MGRIFDLDSPVMRVLNRVADLMILNIVVLFFVIVPFTGGAAITGMHYIVLKMVRDEETYVVRGFWKSFKQNFKQATILWIMVMVITAILVVDFVFLYNNGQMLPRFYTYLMIGLTMILYMFYQFLFPLQARFDNTIKNTLKNTVMFSILGLPRTIGMTAVSLLPIILLYFMDIKVLPILLLFGFTIPAYFQALIYNGLFKRFEPEEAEESKDAVNDEDDEELQAAIRRMQEARDRK